MWPRLREDLRKARAGNLFQIVVDERDERQRQAIVVTELNFVGRGVGMNHDHRTQCASSEAEGRQRDGGNDRASCDTVGIEGQLEQA